MQKIKQIFSHNQPLSIGLSLSLLFILAQVCYCCYYYDYSSLFKVLPAALIALYLWFGYRKERFYGSLLAVLGFQVLTFILYFTESQTVSYYMFEPFSLGSIPSFVYKDVFSYLPRLVYYGTLLILCLVKPNDSKHTKHIMLWIGLGCALLLLGNEVYACWLQIANQFHLFYLLFDYVLMWLTELGYWAAFVLFLPMAIQQHRIGLNKE